MAIWEVVGGGAQGGILVRLEKGLKSAEAALRLSTGAKIKELQLVDGRLQYILEEGAGPKTGWISLTLKDKDLVVPMVKDTPEGPPRFFPEWKNIQNQNFEFGEMRERAAMTLPGDYFGIEFPHTQALMEEWGVKWLTKAFIKTGAMTPDNAVTSMELVDVTKSVSGGAGLKYTLTVKYKKEKPYLHTDLFVKLPHIPKGSDRYYVSVMWGHDRPETIANIWLNPHIPFLVPKMYFCDINETSTNFILCTERVKYAKKGTTEFKPGDIEPAYLKYSDFQMTDGGPMYYLAALKNLGKMAAYHKTGRLHPDIENMFPMPRPCHDLPKGIPGQDEGTKKTDMAKLDQFIKFMNVTAPTAFPKEITSAEFLADYKKQCMNIGDFGMEMMMYASGAGTTEPNNYVVLTHNNCQVDNCIYWHKDDNELDVGMLDWGILSCGPIVSSAVGGCISGAQVHVFTEYFERFHRCILDSYEEHGGPKLDFDRCLIMGYLSAAQWATGCFRNTAAVVKDVKGPEWATVTDVFTDERVQAKWNAKAWSSQFHNALMIYQKMDIYTKFKDWKIENDLPMEK